MADGRKDPMKLGPGLSSSSGKQLRRSRRPSVHLVGDDIVTRSLCKRNGGIRQVNFEPEITRNSEI